MATQRAVCIVRNESLLKEVFIVEPTTPVDEFRKMIAEKFQHEVEELDLLLQNSICPMLTLDTSLPTMSDTGVIFEKDARNQFMVLKKKPKTALLRPLPSTSSTKEPDVPSRRSLRSSSKRGTFTGLVNDSNTCYLNCLIQALFMTPEFKNAIINLPLNIDENEKNTFLYEFRRLFILMEATSKKALYTKQFTSTFAWSHSRAKEQQDVQELLTAIFAELEVSLKNANINNFVSELYQGTLNDYLICLECGHRKGRESSFLDIQLPVKSDITGEPFNTLEEAFTAFIVPEKLTDGNQCFCEKCDKKTDFHKGMEFTKLPYILNISLMRFTYEFDFGRAKKLNHKVTYPLVLNVKPFLVEGSEQEVVYELYSVIIHYGTTFSGHYYSQQYFFNNETWHSFNDTEVKLIDLFELESGFGGTGSKSAYMLLYRQRRNQNELAITKKNFGPNLKSLMYKYLEENFEDIFDIDVYWKDKKSKIVLLNKYEGVCGETVLLDFTKQICDSFIDDPKIDVKEYRLVCYDPARDKVLKVLRDNQTTLTEVSKIYHKVESFLLQNEAYPGRFSLSMKKSFDGSILSKISHDFNMETTAAIKIDLIMNYIYLRNYLFIGTFIFYNIMRNYYGAMDQIVSTAIQQYCGAERFDKLEFNQRIHQCLRNRKNRQKKHLLVENKKELQQNVQYIFEVCDGKVNLTLVPAS